MPTCRKTGLTGLGDSDGLCEPGHQQAAISSSVHTASVLQADSSSEREPHLPACWSVTVRREVLVVADLCRCSTQRCIAV